MTRIIALFAGLVLSLTFMMVASAADPDIYANDLGAIQGADTVAYWSLEPGAAPVYGSDEFQQEYMGAIWKFANAENLALFAADPEKYVPEFGGYCAFAVSHGFTKSIQPDLWVIVDNQLYLNFNKRAKRKWDRDRDAAIKRGHANWPEVLKQCEQHNSCG